MNIKPTLSINVVIINYKWDGYNVCVTFTLESYERKYNNSNRVR
jgi:hypothetical protein